MSIKIINTGFNRYTLKWLKEVEKQGKGLIKFTFYNSYTKDLVQKFNDNELISLDFYKTLYLPFDKKTSTSILFRDSQNYSLSNELLNKMAKYEAIGLRMQERREVDFIKRLSYKQKLESYYCFIRFWSYILNKVKPDCVTFVEEPHQLLTYTLYGLCKIRDIPTLMFMRTSMSGVMYPILNIESPNDYFEYKENKSNYRQAENEDHFNNEVKDLVNKVTSGFDFAKEKFLFHERNKTISGPSYWDIMSISAKLYVLKMLKPFGYRKNRDKRTGDILVSSESNPIPSDIEYSIAYLAIKRNKLLLLKHYNRVSKNFSLPQGKFVLFPLHFQPEKNTAPIGDFMVDQLLIIDQLIEHLDENTLILVKEHISQFTKTINITSLKNREFYNRLSKNPRVRLVPVNYNTYELIDKSEFVVTIGGTVGLESAIKGVPVLHFGPAWYQGLPFTFRINSRIDLVNAIRQIKNGLNCDSNDVIVHLHNISKYFYKAVVGGNSYQKLNSHISEDITINSHVQAFSDFIVKNI